MKKTANLGLNLPELSDPLSLRPLNENAETLDAAIGAMAGQINGCVVMASGSYTGNGADAVAIQTPGMQAQIVLMRKMAAIGGSDRSGGVLEQEFNFEGGAISSTGWVLWRGADIAVRYYDVSDAGGDTDGDEDVRYGTKETNVQFIPAPGSLSWKLAAVPETDHSALINNESGTVYEWVAFGFAVQL